MTEFNVHWLQHSVNLINRIDVTKLNVLATRLAQHIVAGQSEQPFTEEELSKMEVSIEMNREEIDSLIQGLQELLAESAYHKVAPNILESKLGTLEIDVPKVSVLSSVWAKAMSPVCDALRNKSVLPQVSHVAYNLSVEAGSDAAASEKNIKAHLQLGLKTEGSSEILDLEFTHEGLLNLHSQLTRIQAELDAIADK